MEANGFPVDIVHEKIMGKAQGFHEDVAAASVAGLEIWDFARGRHNGKEASLRVEEGENPEIPEVAGELLKDDLHGRLL